jgi:hypothetical protein
MKTEEEIRKMFEELDARYSGYPYDCRDPEYDLVEQADLEARICILEWVLSD